MPTIKDALDIIEMCIRDRFSALFVFAGNFIANVLYGIVDPRLKEGGYRA